MELASARGVCSSALRTARPTRGSSRARIVASHAYASRVENVKSVSLQNSGNELRIAVQRRQPAASRHAARGARAVRPSPVVCSSATATTESSEPVSLKGMVKFYFAYLLFGCAVNTIGPRPGLWLSL